MGIFKKGVGQNAGLFGGRRRPCAVHVPSSRFSGGTADAPELPLIISEFVRLHHAVLEGREVTVISPQFTGEDNSSRNRM